MKLYNVIWFDDEYTRLEILKEQATLNGINHIGFENAADGIRELEKHFLFYDAVIIDGVFFNKAGQSGEAKSDKALAEVFRKLDELRDRKMLPSFILSGQNSFTKEVNPFADLYKNNKVYDKQSEKDQADLWNDIKTAADQQIDTQIRHTHQKVFDVCNTQYIGTPAANDLMIILKKENDLASFRNPDLFFNAIRKIIEDLFVACNKWGFLPDVFIKGGVALNESSKFLSGQAEKGYMLSQAVFPKIIQDDIKNILSICQNASHRLEIDAFIKTINSPYLLFSITYQLMDVLLWFKIHVDQNLDKKKNIANAKLIESDTTIITGIICQDKFRNFYVNNNILTYKHFNDNGYIVGDNIRILKILPNANEKTKHLYPNSVITSEKIQ